MAEMKPERTGDAPAAAGSARTPGKRTIKRRVKPKTPIGEAARVGSTAPVPHRISQGDDRSKVFVAMPFKEEYNRVFDVVEKAAARLGLAAQRADQDAFAGSIISYIRKSIEAAQYMVAVASEENGNVYYEIGLAHCQKKPVVLLTSDPNTLKFDLRDHRALVYDPSHPEGLQDQLVTMFKTLVDVPSDPRERMAQRFGTPGEDVEMAYERGIRKARETVIAAVHLREPVTVNYLESVPGSRDVAMELVDHFEVRVRVVVDVNGLVHWKKLER
jgi:hypothetical protein